MDSDLRVKYRNFLSRFVSDHKKGRIEEVLDARTRFLTVVLENIYQSQNASTVLRTCECLGIQDVHIIENRNPFQINRDVVKGASKWINLYRYDKKESTRLCFESLHALGYEIIGAAPEQDYESLTDFEPDGKIALVFGTELEGLSEYAIKNVDKILRIPMFGFTESLNLSVSAAISMQTLIRKIKEDDNIWTLNEVEKNELRTDWYQSSIRMGEELYKEFMRLNKKQI